MDIIVHIDDDVFKELNSYVLQSGTKLQEVLEEAISAYLHKKEEESMDAVLEAFRESVNEYKILYEELAK